MVITDEINARPIHAAPPGNAYSVEFLFYGFALRVALRTAYTGRRAG